MRRLVLLVLLGSSLAWGSEKPNPFVAQAVALYKNLEFEKCLKRLEQAGRWDNTPRQLAEIELYGGLCQLGLGQDKEAAERFEMALKLDGRVELPALVSPKVTRLFEKVKAKVGPAAGTAEEPPPATPPADAPKEANLLPAPPPPPPLLEATRSRQLVAPLVVGGVGVLAAGVGTAMGVLAKQNERAAKDARFESDAVALAGTAQTDATVANACFIGAGVTVAAAVVLYFVLN